MQVRKISNATVSTHINCSSVYNDSFIIPSLNISNIGSEYQCEAFINSIDPITAKKGYVVPVPGMCY